jgi:AraC family transcriptional regulator
MSEKAIMPRELCEGEYYGKVNRARHLPFSVLSEVIHSREVKLPRHSHRLAYFTLVLRGDYCERFSNKIFSHTARSILWHRAGITHSDELGKDGGHFFNVEIKPEYLTEASREAKDFAEHDGLLSRHAARLYREFMDWETGSELAAEGIILEMLAYVLKRRLAGAEPPAWFSRVLEKIRDEFIDGLTIDVLAKDAGVHPVHLASVFRRFQNESIGQFVQRLRVERAVALLSNRAISLSEVALAAGFADQSHLTRIFRRHTGTTPGDYRRSKL